jgi:outer membrane receptor protein involved in Fe transport
MKNYFKLLTLAVFAFTMLVFAATSSAQTSTTGTVEGVVTDPNGARVPNVSVTLSGPNMIRSQTVSTDENGIFRFTFVPPGRYTVTTAEASGFAGHKQENVEVNLSRATTVNIALKAAGVGGVVDVVATADVDTISNTTGTNVSAEDFGKLPTGRTVQSLYTIAPTVSRSGLRDASGRDRDPSVGGSSGPENNYILDGVTTTDPAFGGGGANLPFEFVQEVEIKTGAYGAEYGKSTGGIFNVITKSGTNEFHGDVFTYFTAKSFVRDVKDSAIPFTGAAPNGFSEVDLGFDLGGPIIKDKLWFFGAFNPQYRKNFSLTQTLLEQVENKISTPFYAGKLTWGINDNHTFTFSTFGDFTKQEGHIFPFSGFGANLASFRGIQETGGSNYAFRLNSVFSNNFIAEFSGGLHFQRANTFPELDETLVTDRFAILLGGNILTPIETTVCANGTISTSCGGAAGARLAYVDGTGGSLQRNFVRGGFGLESIQDRDRNEFAARLQNIWGKHTLKYGFEFVQNRYRIDTTSTGPGLDFSSGNPIGPHRIENRFAVCERTNVTTITCPDATRQGRVQNLITNGQAPAGVTTAVIGTVSINTPNPFLLLDVVRARDFTLNTLGEFTTTNTQSFYVQDDWRLAPNFQLNLGLRWDYQQAHSISAGGQYITLNNFWHNAQPRLGFIWDFTGEGRGKFYANYARFLETPIPLDINVRASGGNIQNDFHLNVSRLNGAPGSLTVSNFGNLGNHPSPFVAGLRPQDVHEFTMGIEWGPAAMRDLSFGIRGIYRAQGSVIEDGSFDDGNCYFIFNPGQSDIGAIVDLLEHDGCLNGPGQPTSDDILDAGDIFGRARRYYRAVEFTATKRFSNNYQFIASYVYSSLIGNYEGLFRNDNGQSDPNITSLFDLPSLLTNLYGRLPNDRPHQFKFDGSYQWPFKLMTSASFRAQSGIPFNQLVPHPVYGDNEGFGVPRGTAVNPITGSTRTPTTFNVDFGAYYPITFSEEKELRITFDWFNMFNNQKAIRQDETYQINSGAPGVAPPLNPFWGTGTIFQFPSAIRLGVKFRF